MRSYLILFKVFGVVRHYGVIGKLLCIIGIGKIRQVCKFTTHSGSSLRLYIYIYMPVDM